MSIIFLRIFKLMFREDLFIRFRPDPFDLIFQSSHIGYIVDAVTGIDAVPTPFFCGPTFLEIHNHRPPDLSQRFGRG
jgi:hypothetical protein